MEDAIIEAIKSRFDEFLERYYREGINEIMLYFPERRSLKVDIGDLAKFDPDLASELVNNPDVVTRAANESLRYKLGDLDLGNYEVHVRFFGLQINNPLVQDVGSSYISKLVSLDSLIVKRSEISPKVRIGVYECTYCGTKYTLQVGKDPVPDICPQCKRRGIKPVPEESQFINMQRIAVQDPLEKLRGNTPTWQLEVWLQDDLVNTVIPGDRIELVGVLRIRPRKNAKGKVESDLYTMFLEAVSIVPKQKEFADLAISDEEVREILELSKDPQIFDKIAKSIAPSIYGFEEIKRAVALQLFGGTSGKTLVDGGIIRSDMHIMLIGDPGSAKTRILQAVSNLVPKGIYVSGKSVTGGGLTAVAERDDFSEGGWTLKAGAMVLGSGGVVAIDEFDKISPEDKASLHEALESQTISVAKAGIIATFSARAAVLAAANPKFGRFDQHRYPAEQFDIPPTLLSRFDLIFPITDVMDEELDKNIAKHILVQHEAAGAKLADIKEFEQVEAPPIDNELLRKYIAYARKYVSPRLSGEAANRIMEYYIDLRKTGMKQGAVPITPRQIEGLVRMSEASAKSRLAEVVGVADADLAIDLSKFMLKSLAVDTGGRIDIDTILTGMPREKVDKINTMLNIIKKLSEEGDESVKTQQVIEEAEAAGIDSATASKYISELERAGDIYRPRQGVIKLVHHEAE
ncbi:minichromosome maintenance protein MCM [Candidatus Marsarchaeota archaeon]|nr:minichromosome maintenance protein MCM [Candidatus Marsarchaeota archaeon]MCL5405008.1 minichromosome maintenance protein MCM [Candidatus Marsarchaeota archaeon]